MHKSYVSARNRAIKQNGEWRLRAFHNTRVRPIAQGRGIFAWLLADLFWKLLGPKQ